MTNRRLVFDDQVQVMGLHIGVLARAEPELYAGLLDELRALVDAGVYPPGRPTVYDLADGPRALADLRDRLTVGKLALRP
ncbi:MDR/zinc-dependent alcohol dehydrogenase-like family protein [Dactylosporangium darangshiense]|uniref:hypothetical protein n=1 Tax=Dactylosporangium darangshiense TaxID=579108 RepID=UPI00363EE3F5